jgi:hypothetical protein
MPFNFKTGKTSHPKTGKRVHVAKVLLDMRDVNGVSNEDRAALKHAVDYIIALERTVLWHESRRPPVVNVNVTGSISAQQLANSVSNYEHGKV